MPNRYLRATYIDSERVNALSAEAERLFIRLLVHVDDFGRCEAHPSLLLGKLFALQLDRIKSHQIVKWMQELAKNDLLFIYVHNDKTYIQLQRFERGRATHSKHPDPPTDVNKRLQMYADANKCPDSDTDTDTDTDNTSSPDGDGGSFDRFWKAYPRKVGKAAAKRSWSRVKGKPRIDAILAAIEKQKQSEQWRKDGGQFIPHPATWLNQGRWDDSQTVEVEHYQPGKI